MTLHTGLSYHHYSGLHDIFELNCILSVTFKEGTSHTKTKKNDSLVVSFNNSFTAITRQMSNLKTVWGGRSSLQLAVWIFHQGSQFVAISTALTIRPL